MLYANKKLLLWDFQLWNFNISSWQTFNFQTFNPLTFKFNNLIDLGPKNWASKSQVFATIYETEGLEHHMAVERAHVSQREALKQEHHIQI